MLDRLPVKRFCQPVDRVGATVFLASDASDMVKDITQHSQWVAGGPLGRAGLRAEFHGLYLWGIYA